MQRRLTRAAFGALLSCVALSCGGSSDGPTPPPPPVLTTLTISFPQTTVFVGQTANASVTGKDQNGAQIATGTVTWTTGSSAVATVNANGTVTGVAPGQTDLTATAGGKQAQVSFTVAPVPVATVTVAPTTASIAAGATQQLTATTFDASNNVLTGRTITWSSGDPSRATVNSSTGLVTGVAAGVALINATSEGKTGSAQITVTAAQAGCTPASALQLAVGAVRLLSTAEKANLCLGGGAAASEYALIPFNNTNVAASTIAVRVLATNTTSINPGQLASIQPSRSILAGKATTARKSFEWSFRERERRDLTSAFSSARRARTAAATTGPFSPRFLTNIAASPTVGSVVPINANLSGNTCSDAKQLTGATVLAVLPHTIVLADTLSPAGGYTATEMISFGQQFDTLGYDLDVQNFGAPTDIDANGRIAILFTPGVNKLPGPPGGYVLGLQASRDLFATTTCAGSNEGEMFYMAVPDPNKTINGNYATKSDLADGNLGVLVHELQHLINAGRRIYVNNASTYEEVWLNEGLSHIAEELLYYRISGNAPRSNIGLPQVQSSQAQVDAINNYQFQNLARLNTYLKAPETNSPFGQTDLLEMRGAIWQLLRYAADRKGGAEQSIWSALVNSTTSGQTNFNAVFGDIITQSRDWVVAQFLDDAGLGAAPNYSHPSWNYRSLMPAINGGTYALLTRQLRDLPVDVVLNGGGASYLRFHVAANVPATIAATSGGQPVPAAIDFMLVRTQ